MSSFSTITAENYTNFIDVLDADLKRYDSNFEKLESEIEKLDYKAEKIKSDFKGRFLGLNDNLSIELSKLNSINTYLNDKISFEEELTIDLLKYKVITQTEDFLLELSNILGKIALNNEHILKIDPKIAGPSKATSFRVNPHIVHSRQTWKPFIVVFKHDNTLYKCNGCKQTILLQAPYLRHLEEYPAGSKLLRPHSYHINKDCFCMRGFERDYLSKVRVDSEEEITGDIMAALEDIGFKTKNIRMNIDSGSESDSSQATSHHSGASKEPSTNILFVLRRKHATQKKKVICVGCQDDISTDIYLTFGHKFDQSYHLSKKCVRSNGVVLGVKDDFRDVKCQVYKLLRNHEELKMLLACGFYFNNIIGNKPPNPAMKFKPQPPPPPPSSLASTRPNHKDVDFIFNDEPFVCERLVHAERCQGCSEQVRKEMMCLRHREQVPRDKLAERPLVSQFYHPERDCLMVRGFTSKYLELAKCSVVVSGSDNMQKIRDMLVRAGFSSERLTFTTANDDGRKQGALSPASGDRGATDSYIYIVNCSRNGVACDGCAQGISVNDACFLFGTSSLYDKRARFFHVSKQCLNHHFSNTQLLGLTCINNNSMVDVNPMEVVRCGLVNIMTSVPGHAQASHKHLEAPAKVRFVLDTSVDISGNCAACKTPLASYKYVLRAISTRHYLPLNIHLSPECVAKAGYPASQLSHGELSYAVHETMEAVQRLRLCGFTRLPGHQDTH